MISVSSRRASSLLLGFLCLGIVSGANPIGYSPSPNCGKFFECPSYTVLVSNRSFEIRTYDAAPWATSPKYSAKSIAQGSAAGYRILANYLGGNNEQHVQIRMTRPFLVDIENSTYTTHLYLTKEYKTKSPPSPMPSDNIKVEKFPKYKYAAVARVYYDIFITDEMIMTRVGFLRSALESTIYKRAAAVDGFTLANYDTLFQPPVREFVEIFLWFD